MIGLPAQARPLLVEDEPGFTFSGGPKKQAKREKFLAEMEEVVPWLPAHLSREIHVIASYGV